MPIPRVRFTVRRLMVAVAVVAVFAAVIVWCKRRHDRFAALSAHYQRRADTFPSIWFGSDEAYRGQFGLENRRGAHYNALAFKYFRAARRPWLPVAPDPPEPE